MAKNNSEKKQKKAFKKYYIIGGLIIIASLLFFFLRNGEEKHKSVRVESGDITQELFETGKAEKGEDVSLSFKEGGEIESISVSEGQTIKKGESIASLDKRELSLSLREARASLSSTKIALEQILSGATDSEREVAKASVNSAENALKLAKDNLKEQENVASEMLRDVYQGSSTFLGDTYSTVREVELGVQDIADEYFGSIVVSETTQGRRSNYEIRRSSQEIEMQRDAIRTESIEFHERENALRKTKEELENILSHLDSLIDVAESDFYEDRFAEADKTLLRDYRRTINEFLSETISFLGTISTVNAEIDVNLVSAEGSVSSAESSLDQAQKEFEKITASPESTQVRAQEAAIEQASTRVALIEKRIEDATLTSPITGTVSDIFAREGEVASPGEPVVVVTPEEDVQITANIYEGDISEVSVGNRVEASFVAFPDEDFEGEVVFINPTGKMIDGVIYYEIKIILDSYPKNVLPQMTVDIAIKTAEKENVLTLPESAVHRRDGKNYVKVLDGEDYKEKEIEVGVRGEERMLEIISGLKEGEKVFFQ